MIKKINRRMLLTTAGLGALSAGAGVLAPAASRATGRLAGMPPTAQGLGPGVDARPYGRPSPHEASVVRRFIPWMNPTTESSINFTPLYALEGIITPNGLHFERHHAGSPDIAPGEHRLLVHGLVERSLVFSMDELRRFPVVSRFHFLECAGNGALDWRGAQSAGVQFTHGMLACCQYTGVRLRDVLEYAGLRPGAKWLLAEGVDGAGYARSLPLDRALRDCMLVFAQNGEALRPEQGYPLRLFVPGCEGAASVKWLARLEVGDRPWMTREETARYTDLMPNGKARMFTLVQEASSVVTNPCPERPLKGRGAQQLSGLAWSGRGRIVAVDVSFDGGVNWTEARLEGPVLSKCLTRFRLPFEWRGEELLVQSRAVDETGYVQPTYAQNRKNKGEASIYHNNSIQTWKVNRDGSVENVQLD